jgi:hypothetical protein
MVDLMSVSVTIPKFRQADFHRFFAAWLDDQVFLRDDLTETEGPPPMKLRSWSMPEFVLQREDNDVDVARELLSKFSYPAKRVFTLLSMRPGLEMSAEQICKETGITSSNALAGVLSWPGKYCYSAGKELPFQWSKAPDGATVYVMSADVAKIFRWAAMSRSRLEETAEIFKGAMPDVSEVERLEQEA